MREMRLYLAIVYSARGESNLDKHPRDSDYPFYITMKVVDSASVFDKNF
jgi:hypothetical protein